MRRVPILLYHWFRSERSAWRSRSPQLEISAALFERQLGDLKRRGYQTVSLRQAFSAPEPLPPRPIVLTFDDGTLDFWQQARPLLEARGFRATLFVVTGGVGGASVWDRDLGEPARPLMSWTQLRELEQAGYEIGSHTDTHRLLPGLSAADALEELVESRRRLEQELGVAADFLAYPRGAYRAEHLELARRAGYRGACAVILRGRDLLRSKLFALQRMPIKGTESMARFRARLRLARWVPIGS